ncbi:MAG: pyridoxal-phosphate dependent enzyme [Xanthomonadales bacterium]|nr:pyridoxal-phosphate dependent enzyme [Xanthomonadales bacterium]NIX11596.1 pyridoxal-phosphate dependent enzyme [Xanthomonadales bacterium]
MEHADQAAPPDFDDILAARRRIAGRVRVTPVAGDPGLDRALGCRLHCKCENLQATGAFKARGALNAVLSLREAGIGDDVATHSSGNHGAALAFAAHRDGRMAHVVMPDNSVEAKIRNVRENHGEIVFCEPTQDAREAGLARLVAQGLVPVHPYEHPDIICGQGTAAVEFLEERPQLEVLMTPVGGGGLVSGTAIAARQLRPGLDVLGAEPAGAADTAESLRRGARVESWRPDTIADGLRALVGELTFSVISTLVDDVLTVSEDGILEGMKLVRSHLGMLIEPSSATVVAAILEHPAVFAGREVGVIFSGGNVELRDFPGLTDIDHA